MPNQDQRADDEDAWDDSSSSSDSSSDGEETNGDAAEPEDTEERPPVEPRVDSANGSGDTVMPSSSGDPPADPVVKTPSEKKPESSVLSKSSNSIICS